MPRAIDVAHVRQLVHLSRSHASCGRRRRRLAHPPCALLGLAFRRRASVLAVEESFRATPAAPAGRAAWRRPSVTRLVSRSRSRIPSSSLRISSRAHGPRLQLRHRVEPRLDFLERNFRAQHPRAQQSRTHAGGRLIDGAQQRRRRVVSRRRLRPVPGSAWSPGRESSRPAARSRRCGPGARGPPRLGAARYGRSVSSGFRAPIADVSRR